MLLMVFINSSGMGKERIDMSQPLARRRLCTLNSPSFLFRGPEICSLKALLLGIQRSVHRFILFSLPIFQSMPLQQISHPSSKCFHNRLWDGLAVDVLLRTLFEYLDRRVDAHRLVRLVKALHTNLDKRARFCYFRLLYSKSPFPFGFRYIILIY